MQLYIICIVTAYSSRLSCIRLLTSYDCTTSHCPDHRMPDVRCMYMYSYMRMYMQLRKMVSDARCKLLFVICNMCHAYDIISVKV